MKNIYLIVGCSGSGKTAITEKLEELYNLKSIQSYTTRPPRYEGETGHTFISNEEFDKLTNMVAYTEFAGNRYCATAEQVETHDLYVIDPKGVDYFMKSYNGSKTAKVIYIDSDIITRYKRMRSRAEKSGKSFIEAVDSALKRIGNDINEFYDYCFHTASVDFYVDNNDNDTIDKVVDKVYAYICECERR